MNQTISFSILFLFFLFLFTEQQHTSNFFPTNPNYQIQNKKSSNTLPKTLSNQNVLNYLPFILYENKGITSSKIKYIGNSFGTNTCFFQENGILMIFEQGNYLKLTFNKQYYNIREIKDKKQEFRNSNIYFHNGESKTKIPLQAKTLKGIKYESYGDTWINFEVTNEGRLKSSYYLPNTSLLNSFQINYSTNLLPEISGIDNALIFRNTKTNQIVLKESQPIFLQGLKTIGGKYKLDLKESTIQFQLKNGIDENDRFDPRSPFIIDPTYSSYLGGDKSDNVISIEYTSNGDAVIAGTTISTNFPSTESVYQDLKFNSFDGFILKMNIENGELLWSTFLGTEGQEEIYTLSLDSSDQPLVGGYTNQFLLPSSENGNYSSDISPKDLFITTEDSTFHYCNTPNADKQGFVTKLSSDGRYLVMSALVCGEGNVQVYGISETNDMIYITGNTKGKILDCDFQGGTDIFLLELYTTGKVNNIVCYGSYDYDGFLKATSSIMKLNGSYLGLIGTTNSTKMDLVNPYQKNYGGGNYDCLLYVINVEDFTLLSSTYYGFSGDEKCYSIDYDYTNDLIWFSGSTTSDHLETTDNAYQKNTVNFNNENITEGFFVSFCELGSKLYYSSYLGKQNENIEINSINFHLDENNEHLKNKIIVSGLGNLFENKSSIQFSNAFSNEFISTQQYSNDGNHYSFGNGSFIAVFSYSGEELLKSIAIGCNIIYSAKLLIANDSHTIISIGDTNGKGDLKTTDNALSTSYCGGESDGAILAIELSCDYGSYNTYYGNCKECPKGYYSLNTTNSLASFEEACSPCLKGTYSPVEGSENCIECESGTYGNSDKLTSCFSCPIGTYNPNNGSTSESDCIKCPNGTYSSKTGSDSIEDCVPCPAGTYSPKLEIDSENICVDCPIGTYNPTEGSIYSNSCIVCPYNSIANQTGYSSCIECLDGSESNSLSTACDPCSKGYYKNATLKNCQKCPVNSFNNQIGSSNCKKCLLEYGCLGGNQCTEGRDTDQDCQSCTTNRFMLNFDCRECPTKIEQTTIIIVTCIILSIVFIVFSSFHQKQTLLQRKIKKCSVFKCLFFQKNNPILGMILNFLQLIAIISSFKLDYPSIFTGWFRIGTSIFILDIGTFIYQECNDNFNFLLKIFIICVTPIILLIFYILSIFFFKLIKIYHFSNHNNHKITDNNESKRNNDNNGITGTETEMKIPNKVQKENGIEIENKKEDESEKERESENENEKEKESEKEKDEDEDEDEENEIEIGNGNENEKETQENDIQNKNQIYNFSLLLKYLYVCSFILFIDLFDFKYNSEKQQYILTSNSRIYIEKNDWNKFLFIIIYSIIFEIIGIPLFIVVCLLISKKSIFQKKSSYLRFGWIWKYYRRNRYWWEVVDLLFKIFLIFLYVFFRALKNLGDYNKFYSYQSWSIFCLIILMIILIVILRPYKLKKNENFGLENQILLGFYIIILSLLSFTIRELFLISLPYVIFVIGSILVAIGIIKRIKQCAGVKDQLNNENVIKHSKYEDRNDILNLSGYNGVNNDIEIINEIKLDSISYSNSESESSIDENEFIQRNQILFEESKKNLKQINQLQRQLEKKSFDLRILRERSIEYIRLQNINKITPTKRKNTIILKKKNTEDASKSNSDSHSNPVTESKPQLELEPELQLESELKLDPGSESESEPESDYISGSQLGSIKNTIKSEPKLKSKLSFINNEPNPELKKGVGAEIKDFNINAIDIEKSISEIYSFNDYQKEKTLSNYSQKINCLNNKDKNSSMGNNKKQFYKKTDFAKKHKSQGYKFQSTNKRIIRQTLTQQYSREYPENDSSTSSGTHFEFTIQKTAQVRIIPIVMPQTQNKSLTVAFDKNHTSLSDFSNFISSDDLSSPENKSEITRNQELLDLEIEKAKIDLGINKKNNEKN
ncbi:hypothetical protein M0812_08439 [Anaeramoeba flamelloides]|uniref:Tyrosine-protein kinase ephrin type A/B receptor-like domain-containing protein n=1 Tax=Anaeramoeba flamelloides TaxID=1746091 RepID=A0AAV8A1L1_9EUKA|nr:hypothetical protein M0812_08439 [Anaeramoeba flamelloides]